MSNKTLVDNITFPKGIAEKYLMRELSSSEGLTAVDMQRLLAKFDLEHTITLAETSQVTFEPAEELDEYQKLFLFYQQDDAQITWKYAILTVDPIAHKISLKTHALPHQDELIQRLQNTYKDYTIEEDSSSEQAQASGYDVLHQLLNDPASEGRLVDNVHALAYANCDRAALVPHTYALLLENLSVTSEVQEALLDSNVCHVTKIQQFLDHVFDVDNYYGVESVIQEARLLEGLPYLGEQLREYNPYHQNFTLQAKKNTQAQEYAGYFEALQEKLKEQKTQLNTFVMSGADLNVLLGLNAVFSEALKPRWQAIDMRFSACRDDAEKERRLKQLKHLLLYMSAHGPNVLTFFDEHNSFAENDWDELAEFIATHAITIAVVLPREFKNTAYQRQIDRAVSQHCYDALHVKQTSETDQTVSVIAEPPKARKKRRRDQVKGALEVDIELQQQVATAATKEKTGIKDESTRAYDALEIIDPQGNGLFFDLVKQQSRVVLSSHEMQRLFAAVFGNRVLCTNETELLLPPDPFLRGPIEGMTRDAAAQIIEHHTYFLMGVEVQHLPPGFVLINQSGQKVLHYDASLLVLEPELNLYAPNIKPNVESAPVWLPILDNLFKQEEGIKCLNEMWQSIQDAEVYNREAACSFQKHLPQLLMLTAAQQTALKDLVWSEENGLAVEKFEFLLKQREKLAGLNPSDWNADSPMQTVVSIVGNLFGEQVQAVREFSQMSVLSRRYDAHPLFKILPEDLRTAFEQKSEGIGLKVHHLDACFQLYNTSGASGLADLFALWEKVEEDAEGELQGLYQAGGILDHVDDYTSVFTDDFQNALQAIRGFTQDDAQNQWWSVLLARHLQVVGCDDLPVLVNNFKAFSATIREKKLGFHAIPDDVFKDAYNMPVTLGRILAFLDMIPARDLEAVWEGVAQLSWQSSTTMRVMRDSMNEKSSFVVPEMNVWEASLSMENADFEAKQIRPEDSFLELQENFYRQLSKCRRHEPLSFYREAIENLKHKNFPRDRQTRLFEALLYLTTENNAFDRNPQELNKDWLSVLESFERVERLKAFIDAIPLPASVVGQVVDKESLTDKAAACIFKILEVRPQPPLSLVGKITGLINEKIERLSVRKQVNYLYAIVTKEEVVIPNLDDFLHNIRTDYNDAIFAGLRHLEDVFEASMPEQNDFDSPALHFIARMRAIGGYDEKGVALLDEDGERKVPITEARRALLRIAGTFCHPDENQTLNLDGVIAQMEALGDVKRAYLMELLLQIKTVKVDEHRLNLGDLERLLTFIVGQEYPDDGFKAAMTEVVEQQLDAYFDASFFKRLKAKEISEEVHRQIDAFQGSEEERDKIRLILTHFLGGEDNLRHEGIVSSLTHTLGRMSSLDRACFLENVSNDALYEARPTAQVFLELLQTIEIEEQENEFNYFMARHKVNRLENLGRGPLMEQSRLFIQNILPWIDEQNKRADLALNKLDLLNLASVCLLQTSQEALAFSEAHRNVLDVSPEPRRQDKPVAASNAVSSFFSNLVSGAVAKLTPDWWSYINYEEDSDKESTVEVESEAVQTFETVTEGYLDFFKAGFEHIMHLIERYPGSKGLWCDFVQSYLMTEDGAQAQFMATAAQKLGDLNTKLLCADDDNTVRGLLYYYAGREGGFTPQALLEMVEDEFFNQLSQEQQAFVLTLKVNLLNSGDMLSWTDVKPVIQVAQDKDMWASLEAIYRKAPFPEPATVTEWLNTSDHERDLQAHQNAFDLKPCARELEGSEKPGNGFVLEDAYKKSSDFSGVQLPAIELQYLERQTKEVRDFSIEQLQSEFEAFKESMGTEVDQARLLALAAELLYRSKGRDGDLGASFEINTTQYLALYSMLKSGKHVTSEIGTGEGKSRIMMILCACQAAQAKTVDFVTSDVQLATRDYLLYQPYFDLIGASTNLIYADSDPAEYAMHGINFSDTSNLSLFRNKARSAGQAARVLDSNESNRVLALDEADRTYYDLVSTRFNYSEEADASLKHMEWVYPILLDFFEQEHVHALYWNDIDACNKALIEFISGRCSLEQTNRFKALSQEQQEVWQDSAKAANDATFEEDFVIEADVESMTASGPKLQSMARIIAGHQVAKQSQFSFGVHQCLHARLNKMRDRMPQEEEARSELEKQLLACKTPFVIESEKQIVYSSNSKSFLNDYDDGSRIAVTGTMGSVLELAEAGMLYGDKATDERMKFIGVPRHRGLHRTDRPVQLAANDTQHIDMLVEGILQARREDRPTLLLCESDEESRELKARLEHALRDKSPEGSFQRVDSKMTVESVEEAITAAANPGMLTISTGMMGRGTDIKIKKPVSDQGGLRVLLSYLPRERDMHQMLGRTARFGASGDTRLILSKPRLKERLGKVSLNDGFYTAPEAYIRQQQAVMDKKMQRERIVKQLKNDFVQSLTHHYFDTLFTEHTREHFADLRQDWKRFYRKIDQEWLNAWPHILKSLRDAPPDIDAVNSILSEYKSKVEEHWETLQATIDGLSLPDVCLTQKPGELALGNEQLYFVGAVEHKPIEPKDTKVYERYDPAHDGRAVVYARPFEKWRATFAGERAWFADFRAWREDRGILFPNLRAWWAGHLGFFEAFFAYRPAPASTVEATPEEHVSDTPGPDGAGGFVEDAGRNKLPLLSREDQKKLSETNPLLEHDGDEHKDNHRPGSRHGS